MIELYLAYPLFSNIKRLSFFLRCTSLPMFVYSVSIKLSFTMLTFYSIILGLFNNALSIVTIWIYFWYINLYVIYLSFSCDLWVLSCFLFLILREFVVNDIFILKVIKLSLIFFIRVNIIIVILINLIVLYSLDEFNLPIFLSTFHWTFKWLTILSFVIFFI